MDMITSEVHARAARRLGFVDLTQRLLGTVEASGIESGVALVSCTHTTCGLILNEWEDGALEDLTRWLETAFPTDAYYAHDDPTRRTQNLAGDDERRNGHSHVAQMIMGGSSIAIPIANSKPVLGTWQRLFMIELDEPKERTMVVQVLGPSSPTQSRVRNNQNARPAYLP